MLTGQKIVLRAVKNKDIIHFLKWFNDFEVVKNLTNIKPLSDFEEEKWIENMFSMRQDKNIIFVITTEVKPIGCCGLHKIDHINQHAEISIIIGENDYRYRGYGLEVAKLLTDYAFFNLNMRRLYTGVFEFNSACIKLFEKLKYKKEGCQKEMVFRNGRFNDILLYALDRNDYVDYCESLKKETYYVQNS